jgi:hypothetical protein
MRTSLVQRAYVAAAALPLLFVAAVLAAPFLNPSFEANGGAGTNTFTSWTVVDQVGGAGSWFAQTGAVSPLNAFAVAAPSSGSFAAMSDQPNPGSHILYQDIAVTSAEQVVRFDLYLNSQAAFVSPATLDYAAGPNQQFRADIMSTAAPITDVGAGVLLNIYQTKPGDPAVSGYTQVSASLAPFVGQTVRLRFAEADNGLYFNAGVDNITTGVPVPTLSPAMLGLMALALAAAAFVLLKRA